MQTPAMGSSDVSPASNSPVSPRGRGSTYSTPIAECSLCDDKVSDVGQEILSHSNGNNPVIPLSAEESIAAKNNSPVSNRHSESHAQGESLDHFIDDDRPLPSIPGQESGRERSDSVENQRSPSPSSRARSEGKHEIPKKPLPQRPDSTGQADAAQSSVSKTKHTQRAEKSSKPSAPSEPLASRYEFTHVPSSTDLFRSEVLEKVKGKKTLDKKQKFIKTLCVAGAIGGVVLFGAGFLGGLATIGALAVLCPPAGVVLAAGLVLTGSIISMCGGGPLLTSYSMQHLNLSSLKEIVNWGNKLGKFEKLLKEDDGFVSFLEKNFNNKVNVEYAQDYINLYDLSRDEDVIAQNKIEKLNEKKALLEGKKDDVSDTEHLANKIQELENTNEKLTKEMAEIPKRMKSLQEAMDKITEEAMKTGGPGDSKYSLYKNQKTGLKNELEKEIPAKIEENKRKINDIKDLQEDLKTEDFDFDAEIDKIKRDMIENTPKEVRKGPDTPKNRLEIKNEYDTLKKRLDGITETSPRPAKISNKERAKQTQRTFAAESRKLKAEKKEAAEAAKEVPDYHFPFYKQRLEEWKSRPINADHGPLHIAMDLSKPNPFFLQPDTDDQDSLPEVQASKARLNNLSPKDLDHPIVIFDSWAPQARDEKLESFMLKDDYLSNSYEKPLYLNPYQRRFSTPCKSVTHYMVTRRVEQLHGNKEFIITTDIKDKSAQYALSQFKKKTAQEIPEYGLVNKYAGFLKNPKKQYAPLVPEIHPNMSEGEKMQRSNLETDLRDALFEKFVNLDGTPSNEGRALMSTGNRYLIAGGDDPVMGVMFNENLTEIHGENLLGNMLMELRSYLRGEPAAVKQPPANSKQTPPDGQPPLPPFPSVGQASSDGQFSLPLTNLPDEESSKGKEKEKEKEKLPE